MPAKRSIRKARKPARRPANRKRSIRTRSAPQKFTVHRRLVVYPKDTHSEWLSKLAWFGSIALKLFKLVSGVGDDLKVTSVTAAAGTAILLGPNDFASVCPAASTIYTSTDKEILALRVLPFERSSLPHIQVKIVPAVDVSVRSGMYAALLIPYDELASGTPNSGIGKYVPDYDEIIKHPRAILAPSNRIISLSMTNNRAAHNITPKWSEEKGYANIFETNVLMVAFSSMASGVNSVDSEYNPARALFEVHLTGTLHLHEPGSLPQVSEKPADESSIVTMKLAHTDYTKIAVKFFERSWDIGVDEELDLTSIEPRDAKRVLTHFGREDLLEAYEQAMLCKRVVAMD